MRNIEIFSHIPVKHPVQFFLCHLNDDVNGTKKLYLVEQ